MVLRGSSIGPVLKAQVFWTVDEISMNCHYISPDTHNYHNAMAKCGLYSFLLRRYGSFKYTDPRL